MQLVSDGGHIAANGESIADAVYAFLRDRIVSGELAPHTRLTEASIVAATGASRTPAREALTRLSAEGYVTSEPNKGSRVASLALSQAEEIFALRQLVEPFAARCAARMAVPAQVEGLRRLSSAMNQVVRDRAPDWSRQLSDLNREFHAAITEASGYPRLRVIAEGLSVAGLVTITFTTYTAGELWRSMHHHDELVAAIAAAQPDWADAVMRAHLLAAESTARRIMQTQQATDGSTPEAATTAHLAQGADDE